jgi:hypothetical protein
MVTVQEEEEDSSNVAVKVQCSALSTTAVPRMYFVARIESVTKNGGTKK